jgi:hypothetical protein
MAVKVSIVIPTRNRAHLLRFALPSAVRQTAPDFEVVVCDNHSDDDTPEVVKSHANSKVVYLRTERPLSMPDNWEYALGHTRGEYITYLTDDSFLLPDALNIALAELQRFELDVAVWKHCAYFAANWLEPGRRNMLYVPKAIFPSSLRDSRSSLGNLYTRLDGDLLPKSLNSICHRSVIDKAISVQTQFFLPSSPDYTSAASILLNTRKYVLINRPLVIDGVTTSSIGAMGRLNPGRSAQQFWSEFNQDPTEIAFLGVQTPASSIGSSLEAVRRCYPNTCPPVNKGRLLASILDDLMRLKAYGVDVGEQLEGVDQYLAQQPKNIKVSAAKQKVMSKVKWNIMRSVRSSPWLEGIESIRGIKILRGEKHGFNNIAESCDVVMNKLNSLNGSPRHV